MPIFTAPRQKKLLLFVLMLTLGAGLWSRRAPDATPAEAVVGGATLHADATGAPAADASIASGTPARIALRRVARGLKAPTELAFAPGHDDTLIVLQEEGDALLVPLGGGVARPFFHVDVATQSEAGLLGIAFAPDFAHSGRFYVSCIPAVGALRTEIRRWHVDPKTLSGARPGAVVLEVSQPYANHNGGQLAFGPDGMLYLGLGDGGASGDPRDNGQDAGTLLGAMLRLDVAGDGAARAPADNPFVAREGARPELFAVGLRNPWRFTFAPDGRLVVADVGQGYVEEIDLVDAGDNLGWNDREGRHCFRGSPEAPASDDACPVRGPGRVRGPIWQYGRELGVSVTGGHVATGPAAAALRGRYVFGDFGSGRLWALSLPSEASATTEAEALGVFPIAPSTFGRTPAGDLLVADFSGGAVYLLVAAP
ncbi:MAG: hypothetical protein RIT45_2139 [Pseudomonadota bacterium]|jgi:glucose/arabinose dehydrogenase